PPRAPPRRGRGGDRRPRLREGDRGADRPRAGAGPRAPLVAGGPARAGARRSARDPARSARDRGGGGMTPFHFHGCWELHEMLGRRAYDERELLEHLEEVPLDSIYFHTHGGFLRERTFPGAYPNDFATWGAIQVRDRGVGGKLGIGG